MGIKSEAMLLWVALGGLAGGGLALPQAASGDEARAPQKSTRISLGDDSTLTEFLEAARGARWVEACEAWERLRASGLAPERLSCLASEVHLRAGHATRAAAILRPLVQVEDARVDALYLAARLEARAGDLGAARGLLLRAARGGQAVLRDVGQEPALAALVQDPAFVLELLETTRTGPLPVSWRDPFARDQAPPPPAPPAPSLEGLRAALRHAQERAAARDSAGLDEALTALRREVEGLAGDARGAARAAGVFAEAEAALSTLGERAHALRLQLLLGRGNELLRRLSAGVEEGELEQVERAHAELIELCAPRREEELYLHTQRRLRSRGDALMVEARARAAVRRLNLPVTGIVIPPPSETTLRSAIVAGEIVREGDSLPGIAGDTGGDELERVWIERIARGAVTFRYRGVRFVRRPRTTLD